MTDQLDTSKLIPLDVTGLEPIDDKSKPLDISGLEPLDVSGLEPVDTPPMQPVAVTQPQAQPQAEPVSSVFAPAAGSSSQSYPAPTGVAPTPSAVPKTIWNQNDGTFHQKLKPSEPVGIVFNGKKMMATYNPVTNKFTTDIDDTSRVVGQKPVVRPVRPDDFDRNEYSLDGMQPPADRIEMHDVFAKVEIDPSQVQAYTEGQGALRSIRNTAMRALPPTATSFAAFNAAGIPAAAWAGRVHPYLAPVGLVVGGGLAAMGAGAVTDLGVNAAFPLDETDELNQLLYPTENAITQHGVALAALRPSFKTLAGMATLQGPALAAGAKGAAINTALSGQHRLVEEIQSEKPMDLAHVFDPKQMLNDAAVGGFLMHKVTAMGKAFEHPGKLLGAKLSPKARPEDATQSTKEVRAANEPLDTSGLEPVGEKLPTISIAEAREKHPNGYDGDVIDESGQTISWGGVKNVDVNLVGEKPATPATPTPATSTVPTRPKVPDVNTGTNAEWEAYWKGAKEWDAKYDITHWADGSAKSQQMIDQQRRIREEREAREATEAGQEKLPPVNETVLPVATAEKAPPAPIRPGENATSEQDAAWNKEFSAWLDKYGQTHDLFGNPKVEDKNRGLSPEERSARTADHNRQLKEIKDRPIPESIEEAIKAAEEDADAFVRGEAQKLREQAKKENTPDSNEALKLIKQAELIEAKKTRLQKLQEAANVDPEKYGDIADAAFDHLTKLQQQAREQADRPPATTGTPKSVEMLDAEAAANKPKTEPIIPEANESSPEVQLAHLREQRDRLAATQPEPGTTQEAQLKKLEEAVDNLEEKLKEPNSQVGLVRNEGFNESEVAQLKDLGLQSMKKQLADMEAAGRGDTRQAQRLREKIAFREKPVGNDEQKNQPVESRETAQGGRTGEQIDFKNYNKNDDQPLVHTVKTAKGDVTVEISSDLNETEHSKIYKENGGLIGFNMSGEGNWLPKDKQGKSGNFRSLRGVKYEGEMTIERAKKLAEEIVAETAGEAKPAGVVEPTVKDTKPTKDEPAQNIAYREQQKKVTELERQLERFDKQKPNKYTETQRAKIKATLDREIDILIAMPDPIKVEKPKRGGPIFGDNLDTERIDHVSGDKFLVYNKEGKSWGTNLEYIRQELPALYKKALEARSKNKDNREIDDEVDGENENRNLEPYFDKPAKSTPTYNASSQNLVTRILREFNASGVSDADKNRLITLFKSAINESPTLLSHSAYLDAAKELGIKIPKEPKGKSFLAVKFDENGVKTRPNTVFPEAPKLVNDAEYRRQEKDYERRQDDDEGEAGQGAKPKPQVTPPDAGNAAGPNGWKPGSPSLDPKTAPFNYEQVIKAFGTLQEIGDYKPMGGTKQKAAGRIENMVKQLEKIFPGIKDAVLKEGFSPNDATREEALAEPDMMAKLLARYLSNKFRPYRDFAYEQENPVKKPAKDQPAEAATQDFVEDPKVKQIELDSSRETRLNIRTDYTEAEREAHSKEMIKDQQKYLEQAIVADNGRRGRKPSAGEIGTADQARENIKSIKAGMDVWRNDAEVRKLVAKMVELEKLIVINKNTYGRSSKHESPRAKDLEIEIYHLSKKLLKKYQYKDIWGAYGAAEPTSISHSDGGFVQAANEKSGYKLGGTTVKKADYDKWLAGQKDVAEPARDVEPASKPAEPAKAKESIVDTKYKGDVESAKDALWEMKESDRKAESPEAKALEAELIERGVLDNDGTVKRVKGKTALDTYQFEGETWRIDGIGKGREPDITIRNLETGETKVVKKESLSDRDREPWEEVMFDQNDAGFGPGLTAKERPAAIKYLEGVIAKNEAILNDNPSKVEAKRARERIKYAKGEIEEQKGWLEGENPDVEIAPTKEAEANIEPKPAEAVAPEAPKEFVRNEKQNGMMNAAERLLSALKKDFEAKSEDLDLIDSEKNRDRAWERLQKELVKIENTVKANAQDMVDAGVPVEVVRKFMEQFESPYVNMSFDLSGLKPKSETTNVPKGNAERIHATFKDRLKAIDAKMNERGYFSEYDWKPEFKEAANDYKRIIKEMLDAGMSKEDIVRIESDSNRGKNRYEGNLLESVTKRNVFGDQEAKPEVAPDKEYPIDPVTGLKPRYGIDAQAVRWLRGRLKEGKLTVREMLQYIVDNKGHMSPVVEQILKSLDSRGLEAPVMSIKGNHFDGRSSYGTEGHNVVDMVLEKKRPEVKERNKYEQSYEETMLEESLHALTVSKIPKGFDVGQNMGATLAEAKRYLKEGQDYDWRVISEAIIAANKVFKTGKYADGTPISDSDASHIKYRLRDAAEFIVGVTQTKELQRLIKDTPSEFKPKQGFLGKLFDSIKRVWGLDTKTMDSVLEMSSAAAERIAQRKHTPEELNRANDKYKEVPERGIRKGTSFFKSPSGNSEAERETRLTPEGAEGTTQDMRRDPNNDANDAFDMEARKASELDRRVKQNAENREAGKDEEGGRRGFIGIMDRAVSEARMRGEITDKEVEGLSRIINYVGSQFFDGVKMSIRQGRPGHQGQYDVANRVVTIFKEAIQRGRFEDTAGHEVGHHLEQFLPEGDRAALRAEWLAARKKFTDKWSVLGRLVEGSDNWAKVKISKEAYAEAASDFPTLDRFVSPARNKKGEITHYEIRPTDEMYRLFSPREWFAETFKEAAREKLNNDPAYTGEQPGWKQKIAGVLKSIKTAFEQVFGREQAKRILANFARGRYKPEDADPSVYSEPKMSSKKDVEAETRLTPEERDVIDKAREDDRTMARGEKPELSAGGKVWRSVVDHPVVSWFKPLSMRMRTIADLNPQSEALQKVVNDFSLIPGKETKAPDYNTDSANMRNVFFNKLTKAFGPVLEDMRKMGPAELKEFNSLFIKVVEGRAPRQVGGRVGEAIKEVGVVLAEMQKYGVDGGLKLGKVEGFFPRSVDANAVDADKVGFVRAATKAYEVQFERLKQEAKDEAAEKGTEYVEAETPDFDMMARKWRDAVLLGREGLDFEHGIFEEPRQGTKESFQKKREFTKDEALLFDAYRDKDVERTVINYVGGLVRKTEVSRRIGVDNGAWGKIKSEMDKQGVDPKDIAEIEQLIKSNIGIGGKRLGEETQKALDFTKLIGNAAFLKLTALLNYSEAASMGVRTESATDSVKAVWQMFTRTGNMVGRLTPEQTTNAKNEIERIYGKGHDLASALAIEFGINTIDRGFGTVASGYHLDGGSDYQGKLNKASDGVYRMYGIHATEAAKREISLRIGADFIDTNIKWLEGTHNLQRLARAMGKEAKADNLAKDRLKELGLTDADMAEFTTWVKKMREGNETEQLQAIMGGDPMAAKYRQALIVFNKQSSVQASRASRTEAGNDTALGRMFFTFTTFTNEWSAQHGRRMQEQSRKIAGNNKYNATERMLMAGVGPAFGVAVAATHGIRTIVNMLTGFEFKDGERVPAWVKSIADAFVYTGLLGPAEILWKAFSRGQLPAGVVGDWVKKAWTAGAEILENPDSNSRQRAVASVGYRSAFVPAANSGLALATEMAPMPYKIGAGIAAQVIANNRTEKAVADLFAGEKEERGSSQVPEPRTPPKPRPPSR